MTQTSPEQEERTATGIMVFAAASTILVIVLIGVFVVAAVQLNTGAPKSQQGSTPYGIDRRPFPSGAWPGEFLLRNLGLYARTRLEGDLDGFLAVYENGLDRIELRGSQAVSWAAAQAQVLFVADDFGFSDASRSIEESRPELSYYLKVLSERTVFAYNHERWFFHITASSRTALDEFMGLFQY